MKRGGGGGGAVGQTIQEVGSGRYWELYQMGRVVRPSYNVPCTADEVAASVISQYEADSDISVVNVPLSFHSVPAWPMRWPKSGAVGGGEDKESLFFFYCAGNDCGREVAHIERPAYQVTLQLIVGRASSSRNVCIGWVPRLLCAECSPLRGDTSAFPVILKAKAMIARVFDRALVSFNDSVKRKQCYICTAKLTARAPRGTIPLCEDVQCAEALRMMGRGSVLKTIFEPSAHQRLMNAVQHMKEFKVDLVSGMRWNICHNVHGTCLARGNPSLVCSTCKRVVYCSKRCMTVSSLTHSKHCAHYTLVWSMERLLFWGPNFIQRLCHLTPRTDRGSVERLEQLMSVPHETLYCKCPTPDGEGAGFQEATYAYSERRGRSYYACAKGKGAGCGFFRWKESVVDEYEEDSFCVPDGEEEEEEEGAEEQEYISSE